ncbi:MAG: hypothetical protein PHG85_03440 [Candidatus Altiarchaeota archaeon]|nr:hypothetical protein [Candidatus Altiarchaeota archaeon]
MADKPVIEKKFNEELDVDQKLREGGILARMFLEVQGNNREAAKKALDTTIFEKLVNEPNFYATHVKMFDLVREDGQEYYSGVVEVQAVSRDFRSFLKIIMQYGPSAIEIISPEEITLKSDEMHSLVADVSDFVQTYFIQLFSMLKDEERVALYNKMLSGTEHPKGKK